MGRPGARRRGASTWPAGRPGGGRAAAIHRRQASDRRSRTRQRSAGDPTASPGHDRQRARGRATGVFENDGVALNARAYGRIVLAINRRDDILDTARRREIDLLVIIGDVLVARCVSFIVEREREQI